MIEGARLPSGFVVTGRAVRREARTVMVRISGAVEVRQVARIAIGRRASVPVAVAFQAIHVGVRALQREARRVVVEGRVVPRALIVAHRAVRREPRRHVVRIRRRVVIREVAGIARGRCSSVTVRVALQARDIGV